MLTGWDRFSKWPKQSFFDRLGACFLLKGIDGTGPIANQQGPLTHRPPSEIAINTDRFHGASDEYRQRPSCYHDWRYSCLYCLLLSRPLLSCLRTVLLLRCWALKFPSWLFYITAIFIAHFKIESLSVSRKTNSFQRHLSAPTLRSLPTHSNGTYQRQSYENLPTYYNGTF